MDGWMDGWKDGRIDRQAKQLKRLQSPHRCPQPLPWFLAAPRREGGSHAPHLWLGLGGQKG